MHGLIARNRRCARTLIGLLIASVAASACATAGPPGPSAGGPPEEPRPVEDFDWFYEPGGDEAGLSFGLDETDHVWLDLSCRRGSGRVSILRPAGLGEPEVIRLESGGETGAYRAQSEPSELHDGVFLSAEGAASDPVFQRFRRTGWLAVYEGQERLTMVPHPASAANVERFFAFCG